MAAAETNSKEHVVVIIGGGYSGTLTAVNLLRAKREGDLRVILLERQAPLGRGLAYNCYDDNLLLNVPAGNMSALADEPGHFVAYCRDVDPSFNEGSFISRRVYGDYLEHTLSEADKGWPGTLERRVAEAVCVIAAEGHKKFKVGLADGEFLVVDQVVLAFGHFSPLPPRSVPDGLLSYMVNPWDFSRLDHLEQDKPLAIMGMGHTAIDALFRLTSNGNKRKIYLLSRRGLLPYSHRFNPKPPVASGFPEYLAALPATLRAYTRAVRAEIGRREARGGDWRDVINELRPHTPLIWKSFSEKERRLFLERVVPYWDIHRHRLAPSAARRLEMLLESGMVEKIACNVVGYEQDASGFGIQILEGGGKGTRTLQVGALVNCTGPNYDLTKVSHPLVVQLLNDGLIQQDPMKLGLLVDDDYCVVDKYNHPVAGLFYVGPMLKAKYWESIAVPELRNHVQLLAGSMIKELSGIEHTA